MLSVSKLILTFTSMTELITSYLLLEICLVDVTIHYIPDSIQILINGTQFYMYHCTDSLTEACRYSLCIVTAQICLL